MTEGEMVDMVASHAKRAVSLVIAPNDATWQGGMVLLCDDGSAYYRPAGAGAVSPWEQIAPSLVEAARKEGGENG